MQVSEANAYVDAMVNLKSICMAVHDRSESHGFCSNEDDSAGAVLPDQEGHLCASKAH